MKNIPLNRNFKIIASSERGPLEKLPLENYFSAKSVKSTMTEQLITPPARVWDKIETILNEQDNRRKTANDIITTSFGGNNTRSNPKKAHLATVAGLSLVAGIIWLIL